MTTTLVQFQAAKTKKQVQDLVKTSIQKAATGSSVDFAAAKNFQMGHEMMSVFLCVDKPAQFVAYFKKQGGAMVKFASGKAVVTKDAKQHHNILVQSVAGGSSISHNDVSTLIKPAANADGFVGTTPARAQAEQEHLEASQAARPKPDAGAIARASQASLPKPKAIMFKDYFYPQTGDGKVAGVNVANLEAEFRAAMGNYLRTEFKLKPEDIEVIGLENVAQARALLTLAKAHANHDELMVRGGLAANGDLVLTVLGTTYFEPVVLRANFTKKVVERLQNPKNAVINLQPGDAIIDKSSAAQGKKFGVGVQKITDGINVGGIKTGTIVLTAHGTPANFQGTIIGTHLGRKTPAEIVQLLTDNPDPNKRLSLKSRGVIIELSGCFTSAGEVPPDYDYKIFARQVYELLLAEGYTNFEVKGMPGPSRTDEHGNESVQPIKNYQKVEKAKADARTAAQKIEEAKRRMAEAKAAAAELDELPKEVRRLMDEGRQADQAIGNAQAELQAADTELEQLKTNLGLAQKATYANAGARGAAIRSASGELMGKQQDRNELEGKVKDLRQKKAGLSAQETQVMEKLEALMGRVERIKGGKEIQEAHIELEQRLDEALKLHEELKQALESATYVPNLTNTYGKRKV